MSNVIDFNTMITDAFMSLVDKIKPLALKWSIAIIKNWICVYPLWDP